MRGDGVNAAAAIVIPALARLSFVVRGNPVSQNAAYRIVTITPKGQRPHATLKMSDEGVAWKLEVARIAAMARPRDWDDDNEYEVHAVWYFDSRRPDVDGPGKLTLDALQAFEVRGARLPGLFHRDSQVWRFTQQKERDPEQPRAEITVTLRRPTAPKQRELLK